MFAPNLHVRFRKASDQTMLPPAPRSNVAKRPSGRLKMHKYLYYNFWIIHHDSLMGETRKEFEIFLGERESLRHLKIDMVTSIILQGIAQPTVVVQFPDCRGTLKRVRADIPFVTAAISSFSYGTDCEDGDGDTFDSPATAPCTGFDLSVSPRYFRTECLYKAGEESVTL